MTITLTPEQMEWINAHVARGDFPSAEEAVRQLVDERIAERSIEDDDLLWAKPLVDDALYDRLAEHPDSGAPRPGLGTDIRIGIVLPYIVIYRHHEADDIVTVLRVLHGRRNITAKLISD